MAQTGSRRKLIRARNASRKFSRRSQLAAFPWAAGVVWIKQISRSHTKRGPGRIHMQGPISSGSEE